MLLQNVLMSKQHQQLAMYTMCKSRVLIVTSDDFAGPGTKQVYHFANGLARLDQRVVVAIPGDPTSVREMAGQPLFDVVEVEFKGQSLSPETLAQIGKFGPDIVHAWTPRNIPARLGYEVKRQIGARLVIHFEDNEGARFWRHLDYVGAEFAVPPVLKPLLRPVQLLRFLQKSLIHPTWWNAEYPILSSRAKGAADAFTAICQPLQRQLQDKYPDKAVHLLYPGADLERFRPDVDGAQVRAEYGLQDAQVIMYTGVLTPAFFDTVLDTFARVVRAYPQAVLVYVGGTVSWEQVATEVSDRGLKDHVIFAGPVDHKVMHMYMAAADVLFQFSMSEAVDEYRLPAKIPEYLAMGKPVVTFGCGVGRILKDGVDVLKHDGSPEQMANQIVAVLADPQLAGRLGANARKKAEALFDWQKNVRHLAEIYTTITGESR